MREADKRSMKTRRKQIVALCRQIQSHARIMAKSEERFESALLEIHRLTHGASAHEHNGHGHSSRARWSDALEIHKPEARKGELTSRILAFLATNGSRSFRTPDIAEALDVPRQKRSVYMNLFRLSKRGQIRKTVDGFTAFGAQKPH
jgi:hypothetical protein